MRQRKLFAVIAFTTAIAFAGQGAMAAGDPQAAAGQAANPIKNDTGKRVCRVVTPTGSRFTQRVCKTAEEWQKDADNAQNQIDGFHRSGEASITGGADPR
jgi:ABC-type sugar transport system substrate-binding protein